MNNLLLSNWYVLQVITGKEERIEKLINKLSIIKNMKPFLPKKQLKIKKKGIKKDVVQPLYPGYLFIIGQWDITEAKEILKNSNIVKFVGGINNPGYLSAEEKEIIIKITTNGITKYSKVMKAGSKIKVISGPLKELEGEITSVDRRKQRAIVKLPLLNSMIKVTLGFEYIEDKEGKNIEK